MKLKSYPDVKQYLSKIRFISKQLWLVGLAKIIVSWEKVRKDIRIPVFPTNFLSGSWKKKFVWPRA